MYLAIVIESDCSSINHFQIVRGFLFLAPSCVVNWVREKAMLHLYILLVYLNREVRTNTTRTVEIAVGPHVDHDQSYCEYPQWLSRKSALSHEHCFHTSRTTMCWYVLPHQLCAHSVWGY